MLEKRIKRQIWAKPWSLWLRFAPGLGELTLDEWQDLEEKRYLKLKSSPIADLQKQYLKIDNIDFRSMLESVMRLTTIREGYWIVLSQKVKGAAHLEKLVKGIAWDLILPPEAEVCFKIRSVGSYLYHEGKIKEAVAGVLSSFGHRVGEWQGPGQKIIVDLENDHLNIGLACGGEPLYRRGYKATFKHNAPLGEHYAAALIRWLHRLQGSPTDDWDVWLPFAGSGTLGFESCLFKRGQPFSWGRTYAFEQWACTPKDTVKFIRGKTTASTWPGVTFIESDPGTGLSENVTSFFKQALATADSPSPQVQIADVFTVPVPRDKKLLVPLNPPYGKRLGQTEEGLFVKIAQLLHTLSEHNDVYGFCLVPNEKIWGLFTDKMKGFDLKTQHFTQGGEYIRAVGFARKRL